MRIIKKRIRDINSPASFNEIAKELGEDEKTIWECHRRAMNKVIVALRRKGFKLDDFFGYVKNEH